MADEKEQVKGPECGRFFTRSGVVEFTGSTEAIYAMLGELRRMSMFLDILKNVVDNPLDVNVQLGPKDANK